MSKQHGHQEIKGGKHHLPKKTALAEIKDDIKRAKEAGEHYNPVGIGKQWTHNFLNQKPWHPLNKRNQIRLYDAEQDALREEKAKAEAAEELRQEQELLQTLAYLDPEEAERQRQRQSVSFMYMKPPGLEAALERDKKAVQAAEQSQPEGAAAGPSTVHPAGAPQRPQGRPQQSGMIDNVVKGIAAARASETYSLKQHVHSLGGRSPIRGGLNAAAENQQFVLAVSDGEEDGHEMVEQELTEKQRRKLLKRHREQAEAEKLEEAKRFLAAAGLAVDEDMFAGKQKSKHKKKKRRKNKKHKKRKDVSSDSSSGSSRS